MGQTKAITATLPHCHTASPAGSSNKVQLIEFGHVDRCNLWCRDVVASGFVASTAFFGSSQQRKAKIEPPSIYKCKPIKRDSLLHPGPWHVFSPPARENTAPRQYRRVGRCIHALMRAEGGATLPVTVCLKQIPSG